MLVTLKKGQRMNVTDSTKWDFLILCVGMFIKYVSDLCSTSNSTTSFQKFEI